MWTPFSWNRIFCVRQQSVADCGAACLATVCRIFGHNVSVSTMRLYAGTDRFGTNVFGLMEAARKVGLNPSAVRGNAQALDEIELPAIAHVTREGRPHFVVIQKVGRGIVTIADPAEGVVRRERAEFERAWSGVLMLFSGKPSFHARDRATSIWRWLTGLMEPNDYLLAETALASLLITVLGFSFALYLQMVIDRVLGGHHTGFLEPLTVVLAGVVACRSLLTAVRGVLLAWLSRRVDITLLTGWCRHVAHLPMAFFQSCRTGDIVSRLHDAIKIRELVGGSVLSFIMDAATLATGVGVLLYFSWKLALLSLCVVPPMCLLAAAVRRPLKRAQSEAVGYIAAIQSHLVESVSGISTIKSLGAERETACRAERDIFRFATSLFRANSVSALSGATAELLVGIGLTAVLWMTATMAVRGEFSTGRMVSFYTILLIIVQPLLRLMLIHSVVQDGLVAAERMGEVMDVPSEPSGAQDEIKQPAVADPLGAIEFCGVSFRYGCRGRTLNEIHLRVLGRSTVGIVGESGSGKTTLARLLLRQFDPECGRVELDGVDLRDIPLDSLRSQVGLVEQEPFFFSDTIANNLRFGAGEILPETMHAAVRSVGLEHWIAGLPNGYNTIIGERGASLSGGQRQRLAIARVLLRDPRILILDEATSNLDAQTEEIVQATLERLQGEKTILIIAHRLSTICRADSIVVLDQGRVVEQGTHAELLRQHSRYGQLWQAQMYRAPAHTTGETVRV